MANLQDRLKREVSPTERAVLNIAGKKPKKDKYQVNVVFDGDLEEAIRQRAKENGVGVATYIKMLVSKDLNEG